MDSSGTHLVLYDGDCGLCAKSVAFILPRDTRGVFRYTPLQSKTAAQTFARHGLMPDLESFRVVVDPGTERERILDRSTAAMFVLRALGGLWSVLGVVGALVPRFIRDGVYDVVAKNRLRLFGRADACVLATPEQRVRFVTD
jgi:predicted DCC family thiol-disulfide oxidoreductase YuxK